MPGHVRVDGDTQQTRIHQHPCCTSNGSRAAGTDASSLFPQVGNFASGSVRYGQQGRVFFFFRCFDNFVSFLLRCSASGVEGGADGPRPVRCRELFRHRRRLVVGRQTVAPSRSYRERNVERFPSPGKSVKRRRSIGQSHQGPRAGGAADSAGLFSPTGAFISRSARFQVALSDWMPRCPGQPSVGLGPHQGSSSLVPLFLVGGESRLVGHGRVEIREAFHQPQNSLKGERWRERERAS